MASHATDSAAPAHVAGVEQPGGAEHGEAAVLGVFEAPWFIALAMVVVIAIILWKKVPAAIGATLDKKIAGIRQQLDEAAQLRAEAEALRAEYQAKAAAADAERETMLERARHEAEALVEQAKTDTAALIERRTRMAEDKIAAAERHALDEVRARAASAAAAAAARLISEEMDAGTDKSLVNRTIEGLGRTH
jgi:F-type H+-transporting ATPase subunit b